MKENFVDFGKMEAKVVSNTGKNPCGEVVMPAKPAEEKIDPNQAFRLAKGLNKPWYSGVGYNITNEDIKVVIQGYESPDEVPDEPEQIEVTAMGDSGATYISSEDPQSEEYMGNWEKYDWSIPTGFEDDYED